jgi:hypothetical protein
MKLLIVLLTLVLFTACGADEQYIDTPNNAFWAELTLPAEAHVHDAWFAYFGRFDDYHSISVLATETFGGAYVSIIHEQRDAVSSLMLVQHTQPEGGNFEVLQRGDPPRSMGFLPNIFTADSATVFWGIALPERLGPDPATGSYDTMIPNDITGAELEFACGTTQSVEILPPGAVLHVSNYTGAEYSLR